jgi:hypothetical protein
MLTYTVANLPSRWIAAAHFAGASHFSIVFPGVAPTAAAGIATARSSDFRPWSQVTLM